MKLWQDLSVIKFLLIATTLEVCGDAAVRKAIYEHTGLARLGLAVLGAIALFGYGFSLNLAPVPFARVVGLYIATLFVIWEGITAIIFGTRPSAPILVGGFLIVLGGFIVTFWSQPPN